MYDRYPCTLAVEWTDSFCNKIIREILKKKFLLKLQDEYPNYPLLHSKVFPSNTCRFSLNTYPSLVSLIKISIVNFLSNVFCKYLYNIVMIKGCHCRRDLDW
jgi:hypothetical protein